MVMTLGAFKTFYVISVSDRFATPKTFPKNDPRSWNMRSAHGRGANGRDFSQTCWCGGAVRQMRRAVTFRPTPKRCTAVRARTLLRRSAAVGWPGVWPQ